MGVGGVVTVADKNLAHELLEWMPSARMAYPGVKLFIGTDLEQAELDKIAESVCVENYKRIPVDIEAAEKRCGKVNRWADHWVHGAIWSKMDALRTAVSFVEPPQGVMLADVDITFAGPVRREFFADVVLSPYYFGDMTQTCPDLDGGRIPLAERDGFFNAGMIITRSKVFCDWWIEQYEAGHPGSFVEQSALEHVPGTFPTDYLDARHNFGKWRCQDPGPDVLSYHMHVHEKSNRTDITMLKIAAQSAAAKARKFLRENPNRRR